MPLNRPYLLLGQVKDLDSENSKRSKEVGELQARVALEEQREEESRREAFGLRQKVVESEAGTEAARKEVGGVPQGHQLLGALHSKVSPSPHSLVPCVSRCPGPLTP